MLNPLNNASIFLIESLFSLYIFLMMLRIVLQWINTDYNNPLFLMVTKLTNPPLRHLCRLVPRIYGIDFTATLLLLTLEMLKIALLVWLYTGGTIPYCRGLIVLAFAELLNQLLNIFFYAILALAIISWFSPLTYSPLIEILLKISEPLLNPIRRWLPTLSGLDLSPLVVILALQLTTIILVKPLAQIGSRLAFAL